MYISPENLKATRKRIGLTIKEAAQSIHVQERTWQAFETSSERVSSRAIKPYELELFCLKHQLPFPPTRQDGSLAAGDTYIVSILGATGGAGRTTIALELGRTLALDGHRVAVITDATYLNQEKVTFTNPQVLREASVVLRETELKSMRVRYRAAGLLNDQGVFAPQNRLDDYLEGGNWRRKHNPDATLQALRADKDVILLDLGRDLETALLLSDVVVFVFDLDRSNALDSNNNVFRKILDDNVEPGAIPKLFTLLTNKEPSSHQEVTYAQAHEFRLPILHTTLSSTQASAQRCRDKTFWSAYRKGALRSTTELITDLAPMSTAALEYASLAEELLATLKSLRQPRRPATTG